MHTPPTTTRIKQTVGIPVIDPRILVENVFEARIVGLKNQARPMLRERTLCPLPPPCDPPPEHKGAASLQTAIPIRQSRRRRSSPRRRSFAANTMLIRSNQAHAWPGSGLTGTAFEWKNRTGQPGPILPDHPAPLTVPTH